MKYLRNVVVGFTIIFILALIGCAQKKAESSQSAIETAKSMDSVEQKVDYLIGQAKAFYNSNEFQQSVDIAQYILRYLDKDSQEAESLLEKAKQALVSKAKQVAGTAVEDVKEKLPGFGQ